MTNDILKYLGTATDAGRTVTLAELQGQFGGIAVSRALTEDGITLDPDGRDIILSAEALVRARAAEGVLELTAATPANLRAYVEAHVAVGELVLRGQLDAQFGRAGVEAALASAGLTVARDGAVLICGAGPA